MRGSRVRGRAKLSIVLAVLVGLQGAALAAAPERVVSLNLCVDLLLLQLADRARIASLTHLATDPELSPLAREAEGLPQNHGSAEEILSYDPDLVIAGALTTRPTVALLEKLGRPVLKLPPAESFVAVRALVREVARALGEEKRGETLIADTDARLAAIPPPALEPERAVVYEPHGYTAGRNTLVDEVIRAAGMRNLAAELGIAGHKNLPLEVLLLAEPERLIISSYRPDQASLARELLRHPALSAGVAGEPIALPTNLWVCGNPLMVGAVELLAEARRR